MGKIIDGTVALKYAKKKYKVNDMPIHAFGKLKDRVIEYTQKVVKNEILREKFIQLWDRLKRNPKLWPVIALTAFYVIDPFDLFPDIIPFAGILDDLALVSLLLVGGDKYAKSNKDK